MKDRNRLPSLDGLRGISCIGIVIFHIKGLVNSPFSEFLWPVYEYGGYFGNYMFFLISGLLLAFHHKEEIVEQKLKFFPFIKWTFKKIYPLYCFSNITMIMIMLIQGGRVDIWKVCIMFLMGSNSWLSPDIPYNITTWFLCVLLLDYLLYYIIGRFSSRHLYLYYFVCIALVVAGAILEVLDWNIPLLYRTCGEGYMNFFAGVLLAEILMSPFVKKRFILFVSGTALSCIILSIFLFGIEKLPGDMRWIITLLCANIVCLAIYGKIFTCFLGWFPIREIGRYSFSILMWHLPILQCSNPLIVGLNLPALGMEVVFFVDLFLIISLSILLHHILGK